MNLTTSKPKRSFTLVELLVVIAIIGVLASLLLPSLRQTREVAKSAQCISMLRQLVQGTTLYANDWDGYAQPYYVNGHFSTGVLIYLKYLPPHTNKTGYNPTPTVSGYNCPKYPEYPNEDWVWTAQGGGGYGNNMFYEGPSILVIWADFSGYAGFKYLNQPEYSPPNTPPGYGTVYRHYGGRNLGFADGHAKRFKPADLETNNFGVYPSPEVEHRQTP